MGEQQEIGVELYHAGSTITVRHDWGHTTEATLGDISPKQTFAWLRFGMAGERKVRLTPVPSNRPPPRAILRGRDEPVADRPADDRAHHQDWGEVGGG